MDIDTLKAQTVALSWEDPSSEIEALTPEPLADECLPLVGHVISQRTQNNQAVHAALNKAWEFAVPFSFAVLGPNKFLIKLSKPEHSVKILQQVMWNVNGSLLILKQWQPQATLAELPLNKAICWVQVHGLPLINMTLKVAISIGKGMGNLIKVDELNGDKKTFRSYLRLLVEFDVRNPLKPGFSFKRDGGESLLIFLKYERLDAYCVSCGRIGHNQSHCMAPPKERFPKRYEISFKHNIFSNILPASPSTHPKSATTLSPTQFSQVQTLENELTHSSSTPKDPVPTQSNPTHLHPNQKLIPTVHSPVQMTIPLTIPH
jgi:hypothetical protein